MAERLNWTEQIKWIVAGHKTTHRKWGCSVYLSVKVPSIWTTCFQGKLSTRVLGFLSQEKRSGARWEIQEGFSGVPAAAVRSENKQGGRVLYMGWDYGRLQRLDWRDGLGGSPTLFEVFSAGGMCSTSLLPQALQKHLLGFWSFCILSISCPSCTRMQLFFSPL